jgi:hypothetical protein
MALGGWQLTHYAAGTHKIRPKRGWKRASGWHDLTLSAFLLVGIRQPHSPNNPDPGNGVFCGDMSPYQIRMYHFERQWLGQRGHKIDGQSRNTGADGQGSFFDLDGIIRSGGELS